MDVALARSSLFGHSVDLSSNIMPETLGGLYAVAITVETEV